MKTARGASAMGTLFLAIGLLIVLGGVWIYSEGPASSEARSGPFLNLPWPLGPGGNDLQVPFFTASSTSYGVGGGGDSSSSGPLNILSRFGLGTITADSPYADKIYIGSTDVWAKDPKLEYIALEASGQLDKPVTVTGWSLIGSSGVVVKVGQAADLPFLGTVNAQGPITMGPRARVYLVTGRSPNGTSFRLNQCTGYFAQNQYFTPSLPIECPTPGYEFDQVFSHNLNEANDACVDTVNSLGRCAFIGAAPTVNIGSACQYLILNILSYNGCINVHKSDPGFYKNEWRVYFGRDQELWKNSRDEIRLLDENGKVVDVMSY
ncbi:MAG: hypothetical protein AAB923_00895 [Patescibacteria group bacterium]